MIYLQNNLQVVKGRVNIDSKKSADIDYDRKDWSDNQWKKDGWKKVEFNPPFPKGTKPLVFCQVQTYGGHNTPGLRVAVKDNTCFFVRLCELVVNPVDPKTGKPLKDDKGKALVGKPLSDGNHNEEEIAWIAIEN